MRKDEAKNGCVTCRSNGLGYAASSLFVLGALVFLTTPDGKHQAPPLWVRLSIAGVFLLCAVLSICWERVRHITANEEGIIWRNLFRERRARWDEVTDYYETLDTQNHGHLLAVVRTNAGCLRINHSGQWKNSEALRGMIQRYATAAKANEWGFEGTRLCDPWPRTFRYSRTALRWQARAAGVLGAVYLPVTTTLLWQGIHQDFSILGLRIVILIFCLAVLITSSLGIALILFSQNAAGVLRRYGGESLDVTPQGFTFTSGSKTTSALWLDVGDYYIAAEYVLSLRGADETQITWSGWISESWLLARIVERYAPRLASVRESGSGWRHDSSSAALHSGANTVTVYGGKVFRYRNAGTRSVLVGATFLAAMVGLISSLISFLGLNSQSDGSDLSRFASVTGIALLYGWWRYFVGGIEIDDFWITQRTLFGRRRFAWISVSDFKNGCDTYLVYGPKDVPIIFYGSMTQYRELKAEIERRAPLPTTGWKKLPAEKSDK